MPTNSRLNVAPLLLRLALGIIFLYHGSQKIMQNGGAAWHPDPDFPAALQAPVAWGEFLGGIALLAGFLSRLAAAGIIAIMIGAIATVHGAHGFALPKGFEYNFALIMMCLAVIVLGSGRWSIDEQLWRRPAD